MCQLPGGWIEAGAPWGLEIYTCLAPLQSAAVYGVILALRVGVGDGVGVGVGVNVGVGVGVGLGVGVGVAEGLTVGVGVGGLMVLRCEDSGAG